MQLLADGAALLVVDMQNGFCDDAGSIVRIGFDITMLKAAIAPCARLIAAARRAGVPIIYTRYVYRADFRDGGVLVQELMPQLKEQDALIQGSWDADILPALAPQPQDAVIDKNRPSAFYGTSLESLLSGFGIRRLVVCGVTTNCCVESTVRDASQRDLMTYVVGDATGELDPERHEAALKTMGILFGRVVSVAEVEQAFSAVEAAA
jgi:ureidoacrylate peracid hydrolase